MLHLFHRSITTAGEGVALLKTGWGSLSLQQGAWLHCFQLDSSKPGSSLFVPTALWLTPCKALLLLFSSSLTLPRSSREAFTVAKSCNAMKPHSPETPVSLLKSLTLSCQWNVFEAVVMSKAFNS